MDNYHIPLRVRNDTPSLCSDVTLWTMDGVEPMDQLSLPDTTVSTNLAPDSSTKVAPRGSFVNPMLYARTRPAYSNAPNPSEFNTPFGRLRATAGPSGSFSSESNHGGLYARRQRSRENASAYMYPKPPVPSVHTRATPSEMSFLKCYPKGNATITYLNDQGEVQSITGIAVSAIEKTCPLLAAAFEPRSSRPQLHLEILTKTTAIPFVRYLYTGSYAVYGEFGDIYEDVPTSLLLHCQLYHLGHIYCLEALMLQANVNIIRQCEFGCSSPNPPIHLSAAINYAYEHMSEHTGVLDTIMSYCVSCFRRHHLADNEEFKQVAYELKPFHQALCTKSIAGDFGSDAETAAAIIRLPFKRLEPDSSLSSEDAQDVVHHFHSEDAYDSLSNASSRNNKPQGRQFSYMQRMKTLGTGKEVDEDVKPNPEQRAASTEAGKSSLPWHSSLPHREPSRQRNDQPKEKAVVEKAAGTPLVSDSEYELVDGPASVESVSSESDTDTDMPGQHQSTATLPIRKRNAADYVPSNERAGSLERDTSESSDSEWSLL